MTAHNRHLLAEGAYKANRDAAAREERARIVALLREMADEAESAAIKANVEFLGLIDSSDGRDLMRREQLRGVAQQFTDMRWAYNKAADRIEAGQ